MSDAPIRNDGVMDVTEGLVTVIVPVFRVEPYLDRCVNSIVKQTYSNLEIILVDDGSPDRCPQMCDDWAARDRRIRVIHKKNEGQGIARNWGMESAEGEYVYFVDSDDYIALDTIEKSYSLAKAQDADIVTFGLCKVSSSGEIESVTIPTPDKFLYAGGEVQRDFLPDLLAPDTATGKMPNLWVSASSGIYRLETLRAAKWSFLSERKIISEDTSSILRLYKDIHTVAVLPEACYFYCQNQDSFSHTYRADRFEKLKRFYEYCIAECDRLGYVEEVKKRLAHVLISNVIGTLKVIARTDSSAAQKRKEMNEILSDPEFRDVLCKTDFRRDKLTRRIFLMAAQYKLYPVCRFLVVAKG